ncbi:MAG: glutamate racemase [Candidatus Omnitrophota bacterium]
MKKERTSASGRGCPNPIGVFDSGLGGLTVVRELRRLLPTEKIIYFGDLARLPYGNKSRSQILNYSIQNTLFLLKHRVKAVVVACNSSSSVAYRFLKRHFDLPIFDVIQPAVEEAVRLGGKEPVGVIATKATIHSGSYENELKRLCPGLRIRTQVCPLFVPLVEEGWLDHPITRDVVRLYLEKMKRAGIKSLILGCTHYPLLRRGIRSYLGSRVRLIDSAAPTARKLKTVLTERGLLARRPGTGELQIFVSDLSSNFRRVGERFLGEKLRGVRIARSFE